MEKVVSLPRGHTQETLKLWYQSLFGFEPSKYQIEIWKTIEHTNNSIAVGAVAGSGKTTTITCALKLLPKGKEAIFLAFNKSIVKELSTRVPETVSVSTLHSFGCRTLMMNWGRLKISENKVFNLGVKLSDRWNINESENKFSYVARINKLVDFMRYNLVELNVDAINELADSYGIPIYGEEPEHAMELLALSNKHAMTEIDFADMIYQPAIRDVKIKKYPYVLLDEAQDLNRAQQVMVQKIIEPKNGRLIAVGDPYQSIYGFAGADHKSYERIKLMVANTVELPLSVCYRCTKALVRHAQEIVPTIEFSETAAEGIDPVDGDYRDIEDGSFVLCRNTKPLVQLFIELIKMGKKANIKGKEIGASIVTLIDKTKQKTIVGLLKHLVAHKVQLKTKLIKKGVIKFDTHPRMIDLSEKMEIINILAKPFDTTNQLKQYIDKIFLDDNLPGIVLSTIHKAKGLEANKVYILMPSLMPSAYAVSEDELQQEYNLIYVARTRAKKELVYIRSLPDPPTVDEEQEETQTRL